jgi:hypothetical protein
MCVIPDVERHATTTTGAYNTKLDTNTFSSRASQDFGTGHASQSTKVSLQSEQLKHFGSNTCNILGQTIVTQSKTVETFWAKQL